MRQGAGKEMVSLNRSYLAFKSDGIYYLLPLEEVEQIVDGSLETEQEFIEFSHITGTAQSGGNAGYQYGILLHFRQDATSGTALSFGILTEEIEGILKEAESEEFMLDKPVINCQNRYIKAVCRIRTEEREYTGFLLDAAQLFKVVRQDCDKEEKHRERKDSHSCREEKARGNERDGESLQFITLERDGELLYVDKSVVEAVIMKPEILKIPGIDSRILGISFYERELVTYYDQLEEEKGPDWLRQRTVYACGVLFRTREGNLAGLAGDSTGETAFSTVDLENVISMGSGIWVRKRD